MPRARYKSGGASAVKLAGGRGAWDCVALVVLNGTSVAQQGIAPAIVSIRIENGEVFGSLEAIGSIARCLPAELLISKRKLRQAEAVQLVRLKRESASQNVGFASRPFVLCGLPIKRPSKGVLMHERRNGRFLLQVTGHQQYGVPWTGPVGSDLPCDTGHAAAETNHHVSQRSRNARRVWNAAGRLPVSPIDRRVPAFIAAGDP
jgi:hypothetical protein